jgi:hypothetical protein
LVEEKRRLALGRWRRRKATADEATAPQGAYVELQGVHCPWDPNKMRSADAAVVAELRHLAYLHDRICRSSLIPAPAGLQNKHGLHPLSMAFVRHFHCPKPGSARRPETADDEGRGGMSKATLSLFSSCFDCGREAFWSQWRKLHFCGIKNASLISILRWRQYGVATVLI